MVRTSCWPRRPSLWAGRGSGVFEEAVLIRPGREGKQAVRKTTHFQPSSPARHTISGETGTAMTYVSFPLPLSGGSRTETSRLSGQLEGRNRDLRVLRSASTTRVWGGRAGGQGFGWVGLGWAGGAPGRIDEEGGRRAPQGSGAGWNRIGKTHCR